VRRGALHGALGGAGGGDKTADDLCARLEKQIAALRVGPGLDQTPENEMGPLISSAHRSKVLGYIDSGEAQGATLRVDGRGFSVQGTSRAISSGRRCLITSPRR
jgi:malonate-semialdehyde dehydrogenase (acetylating)/methylmalonate-semialdehyde dehydrogenase